MSLISNMHIKVFMYMYLVWRRRNIQNFESSCDLLCLIWFLGWNLYTYTVYMYTIEIALLTVCFICELQGGSDGVSIG